MHDEVYVDLAKLQHLMIDRGLNKSKLSKLSGISDVTISSIFRGEFVNMATAVKLCSVFGIQISDIYVIKYKNQSTC